MKHIKLLALLGLLLAVMTSCEEFENSAEESKVTYLPKMDLQGDANVTVDCSESYDDAGVEASIGGAVVNADVKVTGNYFGGSMVSDGADSYTIAYSAYNSDSIPGSAFRNVVVVPCNTGEARDIAGLYTSDVLRSNGEGYVLDHVYIVRTGTDTYAISDLVMGFYDLGRSYGSDYACKGAIITDNGSAYTVSQGQFPVWGNTVDVTGFTSNGDGTIDISVLADFGGVWDATLTRL